jgi:hypothetical protein
MKVFVESKAKLALESLDAYDTIEAVGSFSRSIL